MTLKHYLARLMEMDPDVVVDMLNLTSEELVKKFHNRAAQKYYAEEESEESDESALD